MNFLGIPVFDLDVAGFLSMGRALYAALYLTWVALLFRARKVSSVWVVVLFALVCWFFTTYPLQRLYGLEAGMDRQRNLGWAATAAAGSAPWESGVVGGRNLEPAWALLVAALSLFDPGTVMTIYPFLPAVAITLVGMSFFYSFRDRPDVESSGSDVERVLTGFLVVFLVLLAPTGPLDYLSPYRSFWQRTFLLKPNHALGWALVPLFATLAAGRPTLRRSAAAALVLGALGWAFIVHWALACAGVACYAVIGWLRREERGKAELARLAAILLVSLVLVAPYLWYLVRSFPVVSFPTGVHPDNPLMSVWGDSPSSTHSLFFLATLDLGPTFLLACWGIWSCWKRGGRFRLLWVGLITGAYAAWAANGVLLALGQARQSDEIYFFLVVLTAVLAAMGLVDLMSRFLSADREKRGLGVPMDVAEVDLGRSAAVVSSDAPLVVASRRDGSTLPALSGACSEATDGPRRLDPRALGRKGRLLRRCRRRAVDPGAYREAHSPHGLALVGYGRLSARKAAARPRERGRRAGRAPAARRRLRRLRPFSANRAWPSARRTGPPSFARSGIPVG